MATKFLSVKDAYENWQRVVSTQQILGVVFGLTLVLGLPWLAFALGAAWLYLERPRRLYRTLFWNQAMGLHSSTREGEPEIYWFMRKCHRNEHARRSLARFAAEIEEDTK